MKKILFATTAAGAMAIGSAAFAQGIALFGDARLGLGWHVSNDGDFLDEDEYPDELRAISRVRFGVRMTGETTTGITFGATIRADNAIPGEGNEADPDNQTAGSVFVSGNYGTLTFGDTDEAHQNHVGDLPEVGLTGLSNANEFPYFGNREGGAEHRPTVRYDYDFAGFGVSLSTGSELDTIAIGGSYTFDFGGGSFTAGAGYFTGDASGLLDDEDDEVDTDQIAVGLNGEFAGFSAQVIYVTADAGDVDSDQIGAGLGTSFGAIGVNAFYTRFLDGPNDDEDAYGVGMTYDLGGGAEVNAGAVRTFEDVGDEEWMADFGISMAF